MEGEAPTQRRRGEGRGKDCGRGVDQERDSECDIK